MTPDAKTQETKNQLAEQAKKAINPEIKAAIEKKQSQIGKEVKK